jgi:DNA-binding IclR family transcriptional regulator
LRPLFRSASGKMILTTKTERELAQLLRRANGMEADATLRCEFEPIQREMQAIRRDGHAMSMGTSMPGAAALAILLPVPAGHAPMTLSLGGPMREVKRERLQLVKLLHEAVAGFRHAVANSSR